MGAPVRDNRTVGNFTCLIIGGVAVLAYIIRATARLPIFGGNWGLDDWVITAAVVSASLYLHHISRLTYSRYSSSRLQYAHTFVSTTTICLLETLDLLAQ
jgi:hypothetical protein